MVGGVIEVVGGARVSWAGMWQTGRRSGQEMETGWGGGVEKREFCIRNE